MAKRDATRQLASTSPRGRAAYVALLRGINVGGKNRIAMKDLSAIFASAGASDVRTYIQSGNVVYAADATTAAGVAKAVTSAIQTKLGLSIPVVTRNANEFEAAMAANPFLAAGADPEALYLGLLADTPSKQCVAALDPQRSPGDRFAVIGREFYLHLPNGVAKSKLTNAYFDSTLRTVSTVRNWRTATALAEMLRGLA
ncbi:MAG: DUF1697 domain-containing protein [Planctomycetes bacterium]|nr:DUF1697 domain-containing protein [Planctomycetota bacterium]